MLQIKNNFLVILFLITSCSNVVSGYEIVINETLVENTKEIIEKRNAYFALIKQTIEKQKYYPKDALIRGIEADMIVKFTITPFGDLVNVSIVDGNRAFESSLIEAIKATFPLTPPKNILHSNTTLTLMVSYKIRD